MLEGNRRNSIFDSLLTARGPRCEASNNLGARVAECVVRLRYAAAPRPRPAGCVTRGLRCPAPVQNEWQIGWPEFSISDSGLSPLSPDSCLLSPDSCLLSPVSCLLSPVSCLLSPVSCLLSPLSFFYSFGRLTSSYPHLFLCLSHRNLLNLFGRRVRYGRRIRRSTRLPGLPWKLHASVLPTSPRSRRITNHAATRCWSSTWILPLQPTAA